MYRSAGLITIAGLLIALIAPTASAAPLRHTDELGPALLECWHPPAGAEGSSVTLRFSFRRDGSVFGQPRVTHVDVAGDEEARRAFVPSAIRAIEQCAPLELSPEMAASIGGKVFVMQFALEKRQPVIREMHAALSTPAFAPKRRAMLR